MPLSQGQTVGGRYTVQQPLGAGGMGAVYRAWDTRLGAPVALKEMVPQPGISPQALDGLRRQFRQEASVLANLDHPHLVDVLDFFEEGGNAYLVMRFVAGESLGTRIERLGPLPEPDVLGWADQLLDALDYCHGRGVLHRDIKPQNVIIRPSGQAVLVDFGLVKLWDPRDPRTKTAVRGMGTPEYAPLEQYDAAAGHTDQRSDLYGLGATMYHALTGRVPPTITSRILDPRALAPPRAVAANLLPSTEAAVLRAMEVHPGNRFSTAVEMRAALAQGRVRPASRPDRAQPTLSGPTPASASVGAPTDHARPGEAQQPMRQAAAQPSAVDRAPSPAAGRAQSVALASMVLGIVSLPGLMCYGLGGLVGVAALITGLRSRRQLQVDSNVRTHTRRATIGVVTGLVSLLIAVVVFGSLIVAALSE